MPRFVGLRRFSPLDRASWLVVAAVVGCGGGGKRDVPAVAPGAELVRGASGRASVTYQPGVRITDRQRGLAALRGVSRDGSILLLDQSVREFTDLHSGDLVLVKGLLARRVLAVERDGTLTAVLTSPASLGDVIRNGRIHLDAPIHFVPLPPRTAQRVGRPSWNDVFSLAIPAAYAQGPDVERLKKAIDDGNDEAFKKAGKSAISGIFEGWKTTFSAVPVANRLDLSITLTKNVGGFIALVTGDGYLADFDLSTDIDVEEGVVEKLELLHKKLNGVMNITWRVAKDTPGSLSEADRIKLPAALSVPLYEYLDGLPLFLEISSAVILEPAISGGKEYSHGSFRVTYDGSQGFEAKKGTIDANGDVKGDITFLESQNISPLAPFGMVVAFAAPRIELTLGTSKIISMKEFEETAEKAESYAERLISKAYGEEAAAQLKKKMGDVSLKKSIQDAVASDAAGYVELIMSSGMSNTGASAIVPCTRTDIHMKVTAGASAQAFGQKIGKVSQDVYKRDFTRIDPPGTHPCAGATTG